jgi:ubiquinone/menaquinone biosynthesis C-methylase UbiE
MKPIEQDILDFYTQSSEETRLQTGLGPLEFLRNKKLIETYLTSEKMYIADVGGGTGHYASWLASLGHKVILIDPVKKHIDRAVRRAKEIGPHFQTILGHAGAIPVLDQSMDLVILHGPLYHLSKREDRITAIREARRIVRPSGTVLGFAISHAASTLAALQNGMIHNEEIFQMCKSELSSGLHLPPNGLGGILPESFFHRPAQLIEEFEEAGFKTDKVLAVEGISWTSASFFSDWADPRKRDRLLDLAQLTQADQQLLSFSPHLMIAAFPDLQL